MSAATKNDLEKATLLALDAQGRANSRRHHGLSQDYQDVTDLCNTVLSLSAEVGTLRSETIKLRNQITLTKIVNGL